MHANVTLGRRVSSHRGRGNTSNVTHIYTPHAYIRTHEESRGAARLSRSFRGAADRGLCSRDPLKIVPAYRDYSGRSSIPLPRHLPCRLLQLVSRYEEAGSVHRAQPLSRCVARHRPPCLPMSRNGTDRTVID